MMGLGLVVTTMMFMLMFGAGAWTARTVLGPGIAASQAVLASRPSQTPVVPLSVDLALTMTALSITQTPLTASPTTGTPQPQLCSWTVEAGDTVWKIALKAVGEDKEGSPEHTARIEEMTQLNNLPLSPSGDPVIQAGSELIVPWSNPKNPYDASAPKGSNNLPGCREFLKATPLP
jgi:hypothetical protein